jgi:DHA1 family bicyclomycin/chloramphenicol resistance-like MFS transporter
VVTTAMVRDVSSGVGAAKLMSRLMLVMGAAPVLAPTLGSQILRFTNWRGVFVALAGLGLVLIVVAVTALPETLAPEIRRRGGVFSSARTYVSLFGDRVFVGLVLVTGLSMGSLFGYVAGSSFVFQDQYGLSEQEFGLAFGAGSIALIGATQLNGLLLGYYAPRRILSVAVGTGVASGLVMVAIAATGAGGLVGLMVPMWGTLASAGLILPNAPALALSRHGENAGAAAAMLGAVQFGVGALTAPLVGLIGVDGLAMASVVAGSMGGSFIALIVGVRPWRLVEPEQAKPANGQPSAALLVGDDQRGHREPVEALARLR